MLGRPILRVCNIPARQFQQDVVIDRKKTFCFGPNNLIVGAVYFFITWIPSAGFPSVIHLTYKVEMILLCWVLLGSIVGIIGLLSLDCSCWHPVIKMVLPISATISVAASSIAASCISVATSSVSCMAAFAASFEARAAGLL
jgi:hypothetical protein